MDPQYLSDKIKAEATSVLVILDTPIYFSLACPTLLRIGHTSKILQARPDFSSWDIKQQEFAVKITSNLLTPGEDPNKYYKADSEAFKFMVSRYPEISKEYWIDTFVEMLGEHSTTKLNLGRIQNLIHEEII